MAFLSWKSTRADARAKSGTTFAPAATAALPNGYRPPVLEFRILGPLEVVGPDGPIQLGGPKQRATLAILLLNANRVVSIDRLADDLYAGRAPVTAATQVHRQISELRKLLGKEARLETRTPGYVLHVGGEQLDLRRFERLTEEARQALARGEAERAFELQREALALWRGPALSDLEREPFAQVATGRLEEILLVALEQRVDADLALGRHRELVGELDELATLHPLHEPFAQRLMLALYRSGRQGDALEVYRRTRATLSDGFGIEPGRKLHELERAILNQDPTLQLARPGDSRFTGPIRARPSFERRTAGGPSRRGRAACGAPRAGVADRATAPGRDLARVDGGLAQPSPRLTRRRDENRGVHLCRPGRRRGAAGRGVRRQAPPGGRGRASTR